jgi:hypothetical protein
MLPIGQECARDNAALTVEPSCAQILTSPHPARHRDLWRTLGDSEGVSGSHNHSVRGGRCYQLTSPPQNPGIVLFHLHANVWWGALLLGFGLVYCFRFARVISGTGFCSIRAAHDPSYRAMREPLLLRGRLRRNWELGRQRFVGFLVQAPHCSEFFLRVCSFTHSLVDARQAIMRIGL